MGEFKGYCMGSSEDGSGFMCVFLRPDMPAGDAYHCEVDGLELDEIGFTIPIPHRCHCLQDRKDMLEEQISAQDEILWAEEEE